MWTLPSCMSRGTWQSSLPLMITAMHRLCCGDVRKARNDWAHCAFGKWNPVKFQKSFTDMEQLVKNMALPSVNERELLVELKDWETKGKLLIISVFILTEDIFYVYSVF